jgi:hypothetical protein
MKYIEVTAVRHKRIATLFMRYAGGVNWLKNMSNFTLDAFNKTLKLHKTPFSPDEESKDKINPNYYIMSVRLKPMAEVFIEDNEVKSILGVKGKSVPKEYREYILGFLSYGKTKGIYTKINPSVVAMYDIKLKKPK